jgi:nucleoside-diphosphate kinase
MAVERTLILAKPDAVERNLAGEILAHNLVHGSDSPESAEREIALWFPDGLV